MTDTLKMTRLLSGNTLLVLVDVQERLYPVMYDKMRLLENTLKLVQGAVALGVPLIVTEQYPRGLGTTLPELKSLIPDFEPLEKMSFSCCGETVFSDSLSAGGRRQVLVAGIEAHVCVYQTSIDLLNAGYEVSLVTDCVSSRTVENRDVAIRRLEQAGVLLTSTEMALFELLGKAGGDTFKALSKIVK
jgi:nicotinamidase-related amidase